MPPTHLRLNTSFKSMMEACADPQAEDPRGGSTAPKSQLLPCLSSGSAITCTRTVSSQPRAFLILSRQSNSSSKRDRINLILAIDACRLNSRLFREFDISKAIYRHLRTVMPIVILVRRPLKYRFLIGSEYLEELLLISIRIFGKKPKRFCRDFTNDDHTSVSTAYRDAREPNCPTSGIRYWNSADLERHPVPPNWSCGILCPRTGISRGRPYRTPAASGRRQCSLLLRASCTQGARSQLSIVGPRNALNSIPDQRRLARFRPCVPAAPAQVQLLRHGVVGAGMRLSHAWKAERHLR